MKKKSITMLKYLGLYPFAKKVENLLVTLIKRYIRFFLETNIILLYHKVTDYSSDPHRLAVTPKNFRDQMKFISKNYQPIRLSEMVKSIKEKSLTKNAVAITFDDGYRDNLYNALPVLEEYNIPATIFVTSGKLNSDNDNLGQIMTEQDLTILAKHPLIDIGAHTVNHPNLKTLTKEDQRKEIAESKKQIEEIIGKKVFSFAYPYGSKDSFSRETVELAKSYFNYTCANIHERVTRFSDIHKLPRLVIRDINAEEMKKFLDHE